MDSRNIIGALIDGAASAAGDLADQASQVLFSDSKSRPYVSESAKRLRATHSHSHVQIFIPDDYSDSDELDTTSYADDTDTDTSENELSDDESNDSTQSSQGSNESAPEAATLTIIDELAATRDPVLRVLMGYIASRDNNGSCLSFRNIGLTEDKVGIAKNLLMLMNIMTKKDVSLQNVAIARQENKTKELEHGKKHYFFTSCGLTKTLNTVENLLKTDPQKARQDARAERVAQSVEALNYMRAMR